MQAQKFKNEDHFNLWCAENVDVQFGDLMEAIISDGTEEHDVGRTDDKWLTLIDCSTKFHNTALNFPAPLSKTLNLRAAIDEICWMARGETNIQTLNSKIWNEWASKDGSIGWGYGRMMRAIPDVKLLFSHGTNEHRLSEPEQARQMEEINRLSALGYEHEYLGHERHLLTGTVDQLLNALLQVKARSRSRRIMVRTFNPTFLSMQNLPPCHTDITFNVTTARDYEKRQMQARGDIPSEDSLHITVHMRSSDVCLGRPFNVAQYSALHHAFATYCGLNIGSFCLTSTNTHIYTHHVNGAKEQIKRIADIVKQAHEDGMPLYPVLYVDPDVRNLSPKEFLDTLNVDMFRWTTYQPMSAIPFRVTK